MGSDTYVSSYDVENRLTQVKKNGAVIATFVYDGDGVRVKAMVNGTTTAYVGDYYEQTGSTIRKYYYANGQRVAMQQNSTLYWLLTDHLGSTAITANSSGSKSGELRYRAYGETRYTWGTTPTTFRFTGQREENTIGLYFYHARWYDPALGRFVQADTIVPEPGNPQSLNRYSYVLNNPVRYTDPSGHWVPVDEDEYGRPTRRPYVPPVVIYIHREMVTNVQGRIMKLLQSLNQACYSCAWDDVPDWMPGVGEGRRNAAIADTAAKTEAFAIFGWMVRQEGPWDPKPHIGRDYGTSQRIGDAWYYYDIWGNMMFGYLGTAAGFSESELLEGAGLEQIGSSMGYAIRERKSSYLPRREPGVSGLRAWDDPVDQVTTQIGINLWNAYSLNVTPMDIIQAIKAEPRIPTKDEPW